MPADVQRRAVSDVTSCLRRTTSCGWWSSETKCWCVEQNVHPVQLTEPEPAQASPKNIDDLAEAGRVANLCCYFGSRHAIPQAEVIALPCTNTHVIAEEPSCLLQLVTLPYNLLLSRTSREALGIDLRNHVVIIDEAHSSYSRLPPNVFPLPALDNALQISSRHCCRYPPPVSRLGHCVSPWSKSASIGIDFAIACPPTMRCIFTA